MRKLVLTVIIITLILTLGKSLNPFSQEMFSFHDETQAARIQQFSLNLTTLHIPPRLAPDFSFGMGYPIFNFYAPFSYWVTSLIHLAGHTIPASLQISFLLALLTAFVGMVLFLQGFFSFGAALVGGIVYVTMPYFATEIFVRGNLAEGWFLALFPLTLFFLYRNAQSFSRSTFAMTTVVLFFSFTVHNVFSLLLLPILLIYILLLPNKKTNALSIGLSLLLSAYFLIPALLESPLTYAREVATQTNFRDHFLCLGQLWQSSWGYGGSIPGCSNDGMSFSLGKVHIVLAVIGIVLFSSALLKLKRLNQKNYIQLFMLLIGSGATFLTLYVSQYLWELAAPLFSLFQFPWRFLVFSMITISFFSAYTVARAPRLLRILLIAFLIPFLPFYYAKYFYRTDMTKSSFTAMYLSREYITQKAAYKVAEYLPKTVDYAVWREREKSPTALVTSGENYSATARWSYTQTVIDKHYFPFWNVIKNGKSYTPQNFDDLGRPIVSIIPTMMIKAVYEQTTIEKLGNSVTIIGFSLLALITLYKPLWKKMS